MSASVAIRAVETVSVRIAQWSHEDRGSKRALEEQGLDPPRAARRTARVGFAFGAVIAQRVRRAPAA